MGSQLSSLLGTAGGAVGLKDTVTFQLRLRLNFLAFRLGPSWPMFTLAAGCYQDAMLLQAG